MAKKQKNVETVQIDNTNTQEDTVENTVENTQEIEAAPAEEKKKRNTVAREDVKARRAQVSDAVFQVVNAATKPLSRADISRAADDILGRPGDSTSWVDGGVAIAAFIKDGLVKETKLEGKKKTLYTLVTPVEVEAEAEAEVAPAAE
jgi:hypothetical protein